jgi:L-lactate utilization protein LutB
MPDKMQLDPQEWFINERAKRTVSALEKKGFLAFYVPTIEEARKIALEHIPTGATVGVGGSVTIREVGIIDSLKQSGYIVYDHWDESLDKAGKDKARDNQIKADVFLSSTNALTLDGSLINADGSGNRVASMIFGPKTTIVIAGVNKLVSSIETGLNRIREWAAPINAKRLNIEDQGSSISKVTTIIDAAPSGKEKFVVILVGQNLGY